MITSHPVILCEILSVKYVSVCWRLGFAHRQIPCELLQNVPESLDQIMQQIILSFSIQRFSVTRNHKRCCAKRILVLEWFGKSLVRHRQFGNTTLWGCIPGWPENDSAA
jgi:hypothetical protein